MAKNTPMKNTRAFILFDSLRPITTFDSKHSFRNFSEMEFMENSIEDIRIHTKI
jgi:hypothetical protein